MTTRPARPAKTADRTQGGMCPTHEVALEWGQAQFGAVWFCPKIGCSYAVPASGSAPTKPTSTARSKYGARRTEVDGTTFDSAHEAAIWGQLLARQRVGEIVGLCRQVTFPLVVRGQTVERYVADFLHFDVQRREWVVSDAKPGPTFRTRDFIRKRKWMKEQFGLEIEEL